MDSEPYTQAQKVTFAILFAILVGASILALTPILDDSLGALSREQTAIWPWMLPFLPFFLIIVVIIMVRFFAQILFRTFDPTAPDDYSRPVMFSNEGQIMMACIPLAFLSPFVVQPIMDRVVFPSLGYSYCELLSFETESFGFDFYAYVPDPEKCVPAERS